MISILIMTVLPLIIPYMFLGENLCSLILAINSILFLLFNKKSSNTNKTLKLLLMLLSIMTVLMQVFISPYLESFSGSFIYINMFLYYIVFLNLLDKRNIDKILKYQSIAVTIILIFFIIYEGFYYNIRISGNLMYSNSYALLILVTIYFNYIRKEDKLTDYIESTLVLGLLFTESRTTLILFILYLLLKIRNELFIKKAPINTLGKVLLPTIMGLFQYIIYSNILMGSIFVFPILIYFYSYFKKIILKIDFKVVLLSTSIIIILFIFTSNSMIERIKDISLTSGTLQERLIYFEDAITAIKTNSFGYGINMFKYKSYNTASAFYDVKYIHNSILQVAYDNGIIVGVLFVVLIIYPFVNILKNKHKNTLLFTILYISLVAHSLMDFDFSFSTFSILFVFIIVLNNKLFEFEQAQVKVDDKVNYSLTKNKANTNVSANINTNTNFNIDFANSYTINNRANIFKFYLNKVLLICLLLFSIYLTLFEVSISFGKIFATNNKYERSNSFYSFASKISCGLDGQSYFYSAENFKKLGNLNSSVECLNKASTIYPFDPMIKWNMAYIYEELGNDSKVIELRNELLDIEKYNDELYKLYRQYLNEKYAETNNKSYADLLNLVDLKYNEAQKTINKRARYIKNQIDF